MQAIFDMFDERVEEIDLYFKAMKDLDQGASDHVSNATFYNDEFIKILKANTLANCNNKLNTVC